MPIIEAYIIEHTQQAEKIKQLRDDLRESEIQKTFWHTLWLYAQNGTPISMSIVVNEVSRILKINDETEKHIVEQLYRELHGNIEEI